MSARELTPYTFDSGTGQWLPHGPVISSGRPIIPSGGVTRPAGAVASSLRVVTFNVLFAELYRDMRWRALLDEVERADADVIGFQEVTLAFLDVLLETPWVRAGYAVTDVDGGSFRGYGVVLLTRVVPQQVSLHELPSAMGRRLLVAHFDERLAVATIHLESLRPSASAREVQFAQILDILSEFDHVVLMGDMNFCATWDENRRVPAAYRDLWAALHPGDPGWTVDTDVNLMLLGLVGGPKQVRYDRVFLRSEGGRWQPKAIRRLGMQPLAAHPRLFPSDHFGLFASLERAVAP
ncbi:MAG: hypothetical protein Tsb0020_20750 [Haliangiales bacterium]